MGARGLRMQWTNGWRSLLEGWSASGETERRVGRKVLFLLCWLTRVERLS
jgi:hypothetical protein